MFRLFRETEAALLAGLLSCGNVQPEFFCPRRRQLAIGGGLLFEIGFQLWIVFRRRHALKIEGVLQILGHHFHKAPISKTSTYTVELLRTN